MGKQWKVSDFIFLGSKITDDGDCSHEIKKRLLLGRKVMSNLDSILKIGDITLPTKVRLVKAMVFPVVMYGCESWTVKKAELPASYSKFPLAIYFTYVNVYISLLLSLFIPRSLSHTLSTSLFSISGSIFPEHLGLASHYSLIIPVPLMILLNCGVEGDS